MIVAAGTGGHIYPGLTIAEHFLEKAHPVSWVGTAKGMENSLVDKDKIPFFQISISGVRGKGIFPWLSLPFVLLLSIIISDVAIFITYQIKDYKFIFLNLSS